MNNNNNTITPSEAQSVALAIEDFFANAEIESSDTMNAHNTVVSQAWEAFAHELTVLAQQRQLYNLSERAFLLREEIKDVTHKVAV